MEDEAPDLPTIYKFAELTPDRARYWLSMDGWTVDEAAHLLCVIAPTPELLARWGEYGRQGNPYDWMAANKYENDHKARRTQLQRAGEAGALKFPAAPAAVIGWAMAKDFRLPAALIPPGAVVVGGRWTQEATKAGEPRAEPAPGAGAAGGAESDPVRRLRALRALGGNVRWFRNGWQITGIHDLERQEKAAGRARSSQKTIRGDLKQAAEDERAATKQGQPAASSWPPS